MFLFCVNDLKIAGSIYKFILLLIEFLFIFHFKTIQYSYLLMMCFFIVYVHILYNINIYKNESKNKQTKKNIISIKITDLYDHLNHSMCHFKDHHHNNNSLIRFITRCYFPYMYVCTYVCHLSSCLPFCNII